VTFGHEFDSRHLHQRKIRMSAEKSSIHADLFILYISNEIRNNQQ